MENQVLKLKHVRVVHSTACKMISVICTHTHVQHGSVSDEISPLRAFQRAFTEEVWLTEEGAPAHPVSNLSAILPSLCNFAYVTELHCAVSLLSK